MSKPFIERGPGDVLKADDWNNLQVHFRERLAAVQEGAERVVAESKAAQEHVLDTWQERVDAVEFEGDWGTVRREERLYGEMSGMTNYNYRNGSYTLNSSGEGSVCPGYYYELGGDQSLNGFQYKMYGFPYWRVVDQSLARVVLSVRSIVCLDVQMILPAIGDNISVGFLPLLQDARTGHWAPARLPPPIVQTSSLGGYAPPGRPDGDGWPQWASYHHARYSGDKHGYNWPHMGHSAYYIPNHSWGPGRIGEWILLNAGEYVVGLGMVADPARADLRATVHHTTCRVQVISCT